ncbi:MAG: type II secretion system protein [Verrucomicrobiota bacterium]
MNKKSAFTLIELLLGVTIVGILGALIISAVSSAREQALAAESTNNIRQLTLANQAYASDRGHYVPYGTTSNNNIRWHSSRSKGDFDGQGGYLSDYLEGGQVRYCPVLEEMPRDSSTLPFDAGAGGYGYNDFYLGRPLPDQVPPRQRGPQPKVPPRGNWIANIPDPSRTVMFTSTAIARAGGIEETDLAAPFRSVTRSGLGVPMTPTVHFRFQGQALVAWADGHVTMEIPNPDAPIKHNAYGDDNEANSIGWFGPIEWNGYWNPRYGNGVAY